MQKKKFSYRVLSLLLAAVMLCVMAAACTSTPSAPSAPSAPSTPSAPSEPSTPSAPSGDAGGLTTQGQNWGLSATIHDPATSVKTIFLETYADRVRDVTEGQVDITVFPGAVLAPSVAALEAVVNNTVDIAWCFSTFFPGQFPLTEVVSQPLLGVKNVPQATNVLWDLWEEYDALQQELSPYKVLHLYTNPPNNLSFAKKEVNSLETLKGMKVRAPAGAITDILNLWGASPILMGPPDLFESLEKGVLDGYSFEYSGLVDFKLDEITSYYMDMGIYAGPFLLIMNKQVWDAFPQDIQAAIDSVSGRDCSLEMAEIFQADYDTKKEATLARSNANLVAISAEEYARFEEIAMAYNAEWAQKNTTASFDAQEYLNKTVELMAKYS